MRSVFDTSGGLGRAALTHPFSPPRSFRPAGDRPGSGGGCDCDACNGTAIMAAPDLSPIRAKFKFNNLLDSRVCGQPGSPPCMTQDSRASLAGLGRLGALGTLTSEQETAAQSALADLDQFLAQARAQVDSTTSTFGAGNVKDAVLKNLDADAARIARLRGDLLDSARAGGLGWANWVNIAQTTHDDIAFQAGLTGEWSMSGVLKSTVSATALTVASVVNPLGWSTPVKVLVGVGVAILGLGALGYGVRSFR